MAHAQYIINISKGCLVHLFHSVRLAPGTFSMLHFFTSYQNRLISLAGHLTGCHWILEYRQEHLLRPCACESVR